MRRVLFSVGWIFVFGEGLFQEVKAGGLWERCRRIIGLVNEHEDRPATSLLKTLEPNEISQWVSKIISTPGTVALDLSQVSVDSAHHLVESLRNQLAERRTPFVEAAASRSNTRVQLEELFHALQARFPEVGMVEDSRKSGVMNVSTAIQKIVELKSLGISENNPLVLFISDFSSATLQYNDFSSYLRSIHNGEIARLVRIIMVSRQPINEWGASQGGFNVGTHFHP
jgi:hypothetical protein